VRAGGKTGGFLPDGGANVCFLANRTAKPAAVPFILPFKTGVLAQTDGKTDGGAVHSAVQNGCFSPNGRQNRRRRRSFCRSKRLF